jgi:hypothetical protein
VELRNEIDLDLIKVAESPNLLVVMSASLSLNSTSQPSDLLLLLLLFSAIFSMMVL